MNLFGYEIDIRRARSVPAGAQASSLATQADVAAGKLDPRFDDTAAPAAGRRPNPGPLPLANDDAPEDLRHQPIRWQFPYAFNQVWTPRRNALTPFSVLRQLADVSDIIRICIETRKDQMCSLAWDIVPREKDQDNALASKINRARTFFRNPDKRGRSFSTWLRMAIEEVLVVDALSVYRRRTRGGDLYALELKDGATFLPLLGEDGDTPPAPAVAYRQVIHGVPMEGGDCTVNDLYYRPRTVRTHTPYGLSPVEAVLLTVNAALNREMFNLAYYAEGNIPEGLLEAPKGFTTKQLIEFQQYLDEYLGGDLGRRRRIKVVHEGGSKVFQFKEPDFATLYDEWLLKVICGAMAVPPQEIGFTHDVNRATGKMQENVVYRRGVKPLGQFFKDLFDDVLAIDLQLPDLEWVWIGGESEDKLVQAKTDAIYVAMGKVSVDELRQRDGQKLIGVGPYIDTPMGPVFVEELLTREPDDDPDTDEARSPAPGGKTPPPDKQGGPESTPSAKTADVDLLADLRKWRAIAIKAVKANKPIRAFASEHIPIELQARVERFLNLAERTGDVGRVIAAFDFALKEQHAVHKDAEVRKLTKGEARAAKAMKRLMVRHFKAQGTALVDHLRKGMRR